VARNGWWVE
jgi:hypothetical protein